MKTICLLAAATLILFMAQCSKPEDKDTIDLTTTVVGTYTSGSSLVITVIKVDNTTVSVRIVDGNNDETHATTTMTSAAAFTLNKVTVPSGTDSYEYTGTGTVTGNAISITRHEKQLSGGSVVNEWDELYAGTK